MLANERRVAAYKQYHALSVLTLCSFLSGWLRVESCTTGIVSKRPEATSAATTPNRSFRGLAV